MLLFYAHESNQKAIASGVDKARSICLAVESARQQTEEQWKSEIFTSHELLNWQKAGESDKILSTVPVVVAWKSAMEKSAECGYEFRVPAFNARNPDNVPNEMQANALRKMEEEQLNEHYVVDEKTNSVHYFRPVRLTNSCMACHGDPKTSVALWDNADGIDATGYQMEGWKVGDTHGAFEIVQSLDKSTEEANATVWLASLFALVALGFSGFVTSLTIKTISARIKGAVGTLTNHVQSLRGFSDQFGRESENTSQRTEEMRSSVATVDQNISSVSRAIDEMGSAIEEIAKRSTEVSQVAGSAVSEAHTSKDSMLRLDLSCQKIDEVIGLINGLAEQTNLLALNATIEAARAGTAGKGFAVVANEVKELANETSRATGGISQFVESILSVSNEVRGSVEKIHSTIENINSAQQAIAAAVNEQNATTQSIIGNLSQVKMLSSDVSGRIAEMSDSVGETAKRAEESSGLVAEVEQTAHHFPDLVGVKLN